MQPQGVGLPTCLHDGDNLAGLARLEASNPRVAPAGHACAPAGRHKESAGAAAERRCLAAHCVLKLDCKWHHTGAAALRASHHQGVPVHPYALPPLPGLGRGFRSKMSTCAAQTNFVPER